MNSVTKSQKISHPDSGNSQITPCAKSHGSLTSEIYLELFKYLPFYGQMILACVNKKFNHFASQARENYNWRDHWVKELRWNVLSRKILDDKDLTIANYISWHRNKNPGINLTKVEVLKAKLPFIRKLENSGTTSLPDALQFHSSLPKLTHLKLENAEDSNEYNTRCDRLFETVASKCPSLKNLSIRWMNKIGNFSKLQLIFENCLELERFSFVANGIHRKQSLENLLKIMGLVHKVGRYAAATL